MKKQAKQCHFFTLNGWFYSIFFNHLNLSLLILLLIIDISPVSKSHRIYSF